MAEFIDIIATQRDDDPIVVEVLDDHGDCILVLDQDGGQWFGETAALPLLADLPADDRFGIDGRQHRIRIQHDEIEKL